MHVNHISWPASVFEQRNSQNQIRTRTEVVILTFTQDHVSKY